MEDPAHPKPSKAKTHPRGPLTILWALLGPGLVAGNGSPHQVYNITWMINNLLTGEIINQTSQLASLGTYFAEIWFDVCKLMIDNDVCLAKGGVYACLAAGRDPGQISKCGGSKTGFCRSWGCETTGTTYWRPSSTWDLVTLEGTRGFRMTETQGKDQETCINGTQGRCHPVILKFTTKGKAASWDSPKAWGLYLYRKGRDPFSIFTVSRSARPINPSPVGPNHVLPDQAPPSPPHSRPVTGFNSTPNTDLGNQSFPGHRMGDRLLSLIEGAFLALNSTDPNKTRECWLCLLNQPPYYEGVAILGNFTNHTSAPGTCGNAPQHKLTLFEVSGRGLCIGKVPSTHQDLCSSTQIVGPGSYYLTGPNGNYWACSTGLMPCVSASVLNTSADYCVLVELWPKVVYHESEYIYNHFEGMIRYHREPVSLTLALLLGGLTE